MLFVHKFHVRKLEPENNEIILRSMNTTSFKFLNVKFVNEKEGRLRNDLEKTKDVTTDNKKR